MSPAEFAHFFGALVSRGRADAARLFAAWLVAPIAAVWDYGKRRAPVPDSLILASASEVPDGRVAAGNDAAYVDFEASFYDQAQAHEKAAFWVRYLASKMPGLRPGEGAVLDIGAGRGELLEALAQAGHRAAGVEINAVAAQALQRKGFNVEHADALTALSGRDDASVQAIFLIQVLEHLEWDYAARLLQVITKKLAPGGLLVIETVNPECPLALSTFWLDPTHVRLYPAQTLAFFLSSTGFTDAERVYRAPVNWRYRVAGIPESNYVEVAVTCRVPERSLQGDR